MSTFVGVIIIVILAGALTTCLSRLRKDYPHSIFKPFSSCYCDHCNAKVTTSQTIPIVSYLLLQGKTKCCNKDIPVRYITIELCSLAVNLFLLLTLKEMPWVCYFSICGFSFTLLLGFALYFYRLEIKVSNLVQSGFFILLINLPILLILML